MTNPMIERARLKREKNRLGEGSSGNDGSSSGDYDDLSTEGEVVPDFDPDTDARSRTPMKANPRRQTRDGKPAPIAVMPVLDELYEDDPDDHAINLIGDNTQVSDASTAIKALLGEGGDIRAASQLEEDQLVAIFDILYVGEQMNSPASLKIAENFLLLRISANGGTGRQQVMGAFRGLYEPQAVQQGDPNQIPSGSLRGRP